MRGRLPGDRSGRHAALLGRQLRCQLRCCEDVEKGDMDDSFDEGKRVEFEAEAGKLEQDLGLNVSFNPCYRKTRLAKLFGRLTNCPEREGCFKLLFPNGTVFEDPEHPPSHDDILQASLGEGADSLWVTWRSIGLKRNDYNTWGLCLPKDNADGKHYAMAVFNTLKQR
uniref:Uncharacterized protein n=1 Tax=Alexandrium monilatum TaxID=311494 RepID=A0A7S4SWP7_9DINO